MRRLYARVEVPDWEKPVYVHPDRMSLVKKAAAGTLTATKTTLLSPFDPLISDRDRALDLFGFDYKLESYTPVKDRQFGFFCLPILHHGRLVGRLDPKAHRKEKWLEIKNIFLEPDFEIDDDFVSAFRQTLEDFTAWQGLTSYRVAACDSPELERALK